MADMQDDTSLKAQSNQVVAPSPKHTHTNPFNSDCPACKLVCLSCIGQKWEFYIEGENSPVKAGVCSWCDGEGTREAYNRGNLRYQERVNDLLLKAQKPSSGHIKAQS